MLERFTPFQGVLTIGMSAMVAEATFVPAFIEKSQDANILPPFLMIWGTFGLTVIIASVTKSIQHRKEMTATAERVNEYLIKTEEYAVPQRLEDHRKTV